MDIRVIGASLMLLAISLPLKSAEYSILPVEGSVIVSTDGSSFSMEVIDTNYARGTFNISLVDGTYDSYIGNRAINGQAELDTSEVELPAVRNTSDVVAWNQGGGDGGGGNEIQSRRKAPGRDSDVEVQWRFIVRAVRSYCTSASSHAAAAIAAASASCAAGGGSHSGGSLGVCGIGADTGECNRTPVVK